MKKLGRAVFLLAAAVSTVCIFSGTSKVKAGDQQMIEDGVYIGNVNVGGMTEEQARSAVEEYVAGLLNTNFTLKGETGSLEMTAEDMGVTADADAAAKEAVQIGHAGSLINRYKTLQDLLDAAKGGKKLTISTGGGPGSDDDVLIRQINSRLKIDTLIPGGNENDGEAKNALLNKEADAQACNVSNYFKTYESTGQTDSVRVLAIFDANKQVLMPNAPLIDDLNIAELKGLYSSSDRGLVACKALDPAVLQIIVDALKKAQADPDFQKDAAEKGMGINMLFGDDFNKFIDGVESTLIELAPQIGWDVDASKYGK